MSVFGEPKDKDLSQTAILAEIAKTLAAVQQQASNAHNADQLEQMTATLKELAVRTRPENPEHSRVSAYNPKGLRDAERPQLKCEIWWVGYPETPETLTDEEIETLNLLEPGEYFVTKGNGARIPFNVTAKKNLSGNFERLEVWFPCKGDQMHDHGTKLAYVREAMGMSKGQPTIQSLQAQIAALQQQLATANAVIEAA